MVEEFQNKVIERFKIKNMINCYKCFSDISNFEELDRHIQKVVNLVRVYLFKQENTDVKLAGKEAYNGEFEKFLDGNYNIKVKLR